MKRRPLAVAILLACTVALAACNNQKLPPTSSASSTPSSSSSASASPVPSPTKALTPAEQDLKSAGEAITEYWRVLDAVASDPNVSLNVLATVARSQALEQWQTTLAADRGQGVEQQGRARVRDAVASSGDGKTFAVTACVDFSEVDVVDASGKSVVKAGRPVEQRYSYVVQKAPEGFFVTEDLFKGQPCTS
jgi:hypothetical protein